jgi:hypothetical protein
MNIREAAFGDPEEVSMASTELHRLTQCNCKFRIYYAEFQPLMAILEYDSKGKKATLKQCLSQELQSGLVYQTDKPVDVFKFVELYMTPDYHIQA